MNRRDFLKLAGAAGLSIGVPWGLARATDERFDGPFFAVFNASGGWDTTYLMDPKGGTAINDLYGPDDHRMAGRLIYAPTEGNIAPEAMTNRTFFERYASELLVVNGIDISVNNHSPCSRYVATGELDSRIYPTLPALLAGVRCPEAPLAFLTFGQYSGTGGIVARSRVPYMSSLRQLAAVDYAGTTARTRPYHHAEAFGAIEDSLREAALYPPTLPKIAQAHAHVYTAQASSKALERLVPFIPDSAPSGRLRSQAEIALAGFAAGVTVAANLSIGQFDSHGSNDPDQMLLIPEFLDGIDYILRRAEELGLRDQLVVVIQSEMGRTPWYNMTRGKDHWSIGSMMFLGRGIRGNRIVGRTQVDSESGFDQSPVRVDPETLEESESGIRIRPQHIQQALREHAGIADHPLSLEYDLDLGEDERLVGLFT